MRIIEQIFSDYKGIPKLFIEHHMDNHVGSQDGVPIFDKDLAAHLTRLSLNNTVLLLMGDHGLTDGSTKRGVHEHNNPVLYHGGQTHIQSREWEWK